MAGFKTFTSATLSSADVNGYLMKQVVIQCTSATRPTGVEGMTIYETDTDKLLTYTGATWSSIGPVSGALTSWTPTVTQSGSVTVTVLSATYQRIGRRITANCLLQVTGAGTAANAITISGLPATAVANQSVVGSGYILDSSAATFYAGTAVLATTTTVQIMPGGGVTAVLGAAQMTAALAAPDSISISISYEAGADA